MMDMSAPKPTHTPVAKPVIKGTQPDHHVTTPANNTKTAAPVGAAAIAALQQQVSTTGVKQAAVNAKKAIDKKYPGLYTK